MKHFLSCDWGTTSLRLRLAAIDDYEILAEVRSDEGIAQVFDRWQQSGLKEDKKAEFYLDVISRQVKELEKQTGRQLKGLALVISGMASSSIGFIDLPYTSMPFSVDGRDMVTAFIEANETFAHDVLIISGAKTGEDVMRGEETQLIGCVRPDRQVRNELFIFPGTHSKHILVKSNKAIGLKTYMTGEVFSLLTQNSILKKSVDCGAFDANAFKKGLADATFGNILNLAFKIRTNSLFDICGNVENYHYLSGLLIGSELKELASANVDTINLICGKELLPAYQIALKELAGNNALVIFSSEQTDKATVLGQFAIAKHLNILL